MKEYKVAIGMEPTYKIGMSPNSRNGFKIGNKSGNRKGAKHTKKTKLKMSVIQKGKRAGASNPMWKGGITKLKKQEKIAGRARPEGCEICGAMGTICFDHNHKTGIFRGWICHRCNLVLGLVKDSSELLNQLSDYLK